MVELFGIHILSKGEEAVKNQKEKEKDDGTCN
jgi:hypothetical protein